VELVERQLPYIVASPSRDVLDEVVLETITPDREHQLPTRLEHTNRLSERPPEVAGIFEVVEEAEPQHHVKRFVWEGEVAYVLDLDVSVRIDVPDVLDCVAAEVDAGQVVALVAVVKNSRPGP